MWFIDLWMSTRISTFSKVIKIIIKRNFKSNSFEILDFAFGENNWEWRSMGEQLTFHHKLICII